MSEISAIKRSRVAQEGARRFFQTTELIASHLKRSSDKNLVFALSSKKNNLSNLLAASCAIHCFNYLGIRTKTDEQMVSQVTSMEAFETVEKREIYKEFLDLIGSSIQHEISLSLLELNYEEQILTAMIEKKNVYEERFIQNLTDQLEEHLIKSLNQYPTVFWIDHVGELTGFIPFVKSQILEETAGLKATAIDLEKNLKGEEKGDRYIELSTIFHLINKMQKSFEFSSTRDLKLETFPIKKILNQIIAYRLNFYPISKVGLVCFQDATKLKKIIYKKLLDADTTPIDYESLELDLTVLIRENIIEQAQKGPNKFVYFLQNLLELTFEETFSVLSRFGVSNVSLFCHILSFDYNQFKNDISLNQLSKMDFLTADSQKSLIWKVEQKLNEIKLISLSRSERSVEEILNNFEESEILVLKNICRTLKIEFDDLRQLFQKKMIIEKIIRKKYPLKGPTSCYSMVFDIPEILANLCKTIYFTFFRKISCQFARVLETYVKIKEDKGLYLLGIKRIFESTANEEWVVIKIEELIIQRLMRRQEELAMIFNAENDAFLVNSFIYARLFDCNLSDANEILHNEPSFFYGDSIGLGLPKDMISPVSYIFAYDLLYRFKDNQEFLKIQKEQLKEMKNQKSTEKRDEIKKVQKLNTLNWIDKKITSSLMSVSAVSVNPTTLYWNEKDTQIVIDNLMIHSKLKDRKICSECNYDVSSSSCEHPNSHRKANAIDLMAQYYHFALTRIKQNWEKTKVPTIQELTDNIHIWLNEIMFPRLNRNITENDIDQMIEGERRGLSQKIAIAIGQKLDKAIYKKFKANLKKKRGT
ncbi:hypothetical protein [Candidatus Lokiarchaeum ossiferum]|uniref:hypothetical protein n=1 Tax=Candidatus Lokiarchaeum ossiferum TaxID=2951803 RepID=UPI00352C9186